MWRQAATDIDPRLFNKCLIRPDRCELQRLIELQRDAGGFKVVEDEIHVTETSVLCGYDPQDSDGTSSVALGGKLPFAVGRMTVGEGTTGAWCAGPES